MDGETEELQRRSEAVRSGAATTLRRFGIVEADSEADQRRIDSLRDATFKRVAQLSYQHGTVGEVQEFFGAINWNELPAIRSRVIRFYFSDPAKLTIEPSKVNFYEESTRFRIAADKEIVDLLESLHAELRKYEPRVIDTRTMPERLRSECFARVAELSGRTEKEVARFYDGLDWRALPKDRSAEIHRCMSPELPRVTTFDPRRSANNQAEYEQYKRELRTHELAMPFVDEAVRQITRLFVNLHGELGSLRTAELARAAEAKRLDQQIAHLQRVRDGVQAQI